MFFWCVKVWKILASRRLTCIGFNKNSSSWKKFFYPNKKATLAVKESSCWSCQKSFKITNEILNAIKNNSSIQERKKYEGTSNIFFSVTRKRFYLLRFQSEDNWLKKQNYFWNKKGFFKLNEEAVGLLRLQ